MIVFFGHQSVGAEIVAGVRELAGSGASSWHVAAIEDVSAARPRQLLHAKIGKNGDAGSKLDDFASQLQSHGGLGIGIAMMKFCYVDVRSHAQAETLLRLYWERMQTLQERHEAVRFAHCTVPLRRLPMGAYAWVRRALGHRHPEFEANAAREWFNDQLRAACADSARERRLFDLAKLQSTHADGRRCVGGSRRHPIASLAAEWTYDGGHLNAQGRTMAAAAFLRFLETFQ